MGFLRHYETKRYLPITDYLSVHQHRTYDSTSYDWKSEPLLTQCEYWWQKVIRACTHEQSLYKLYDVTVRVNVDNTGTGTSLLTNLRKSLLNGISVSISCYFCFVITSMIIHNTEITSNDSSSQWLWLCLMTMSSDCFSLGECPMTSPFRFSLIYFDINLTSEWPWLCPMTMSDDYVRYFTMSFRNLLPRANSAYVSVTDKSTITPAYPLTIIQDCTFSPVYHLSVLQ